MEIKAFLTKFETTLIENGFSPEAARHHTLKVAKGLSDSDKKRILTFETEIQAKTIARNYAAKLRRKTEAVSESDTNANTVTITNDFRNSIPVESAPEEVRVYSSKSVKNEDEDEYETTEEAKTMKFSAVKNPAYDDFEFDPTDYDYIKTMKIDSVKNTSENIASKTEDVQNEATKKVDKVSQIKKTLSPEAKKEFNNQILKRLPVFILGFLGAGLGALVVYTLICALIATFVAALVCVAAVGSVGTLAGLIYGIIKIFSVVPEGLYEIGFAFVIAGITTILSIGFYNIAVRAIPILWKKFTYFLTDCFNKFKTYIRRIRKECEDK